VDGVDGFRYDTAIYVEHEFRRDFFISTQPDFPRDRDICSRFREGSFPELR